MSKNNLEDQLSRKKIFVVKYAAIIILLIALTMLFVLLKLKIGDEAVLSMIFRYYTKK